MKNKKSHEIIAQGLVILENLEHRGAVGADPKAGDGCGILVQIPHAFFQSIGDELGFALPAAGAYGIAQMFLPKDKRQKETIMQVFAEEISSHGMELLGWRDVPVDNCDLGYSVLPTPER